MQLVAIARAPAQPEQAAEALAKAAALALAEARMRLAREPPALVARLEPAAAGALVAALRAAGLAALAIDARCPSDADRTVARAVAVGDDRVALTPRDGAPVEWAWPELLAILRGIRLSRSEVERTEKSKSFSVATAVASGGLMMTRKVERTVRSSEEKVEQLILLYGRDGGAAMILEGQVEFSCLGPAMQPSSAANMAELARRLREKAKGVFYDERLLRLGRRPLPYLPGGESRSQTSSVTKTSLDTAGALDVLAEVMRRALLLGLLP